MSIELVLPLAPKAGPLRAQLMLTVDASAEAGPPVALFRIDATLPEFYVRHDDLLDFCAACVAIIQARRPRVSPY